MSWEDMLKREPISYRDRKDLMDVQPRLDKGAIAYIQSLGEGNWWNEDNKHMRNHIENYFDYYSSGDKRLDYTPHSYPKIMGQNEIQIKAKNKTLTEDEWRKYVERVDDSKRRMSSMIDDYLWPAEG